MTKQQSVTAQYRESLRDQLEITAELLHDPDVAEQVVERSTFTILETVLFRSGLGEEQAAALLIGVELGRRGMRRLERLGQEVDGN